MSKLGWGVLLVLAGACASGGAPRSGESGEEVFASRDVLTRQQIDKIHATNAYDAVERLRSRWLRLRGSSQLPAQNAGSIQFRENQVQVYLDNQRLGNLEHLRRIEIAAVQYIRYFSATEASSRWGFNHGGGAIYVSTRPMGRWAIDKPHW